MDTGEIEVQLESVKSINQSEVKLPFYVKSFNEAQETLRHSGFLLFFHQNFQHLSWFSSYSKTTLASFLLFDHLPIQPILMLAYLTLNVDIN